MGEQQNLHLLAQFATVPSPNSPDIIGKTTQIIKEKNMFKYQ